MKVTSFLLVAALVCALLTAAPVHGSLASAAAGRGRVFGVAISNSHMNDGTYVNLFDTEFSSVTCENEMKWDATEWNQNQFTYGNADNIVNHARSHNIAVRGHTLVWHAQLPTWVKDITNPTTLLNVMNNHITHVAQYYAGKVYAWDVVNEAFDDGGNGMRNAQESVWTRVLGNNYNFIETALRTARAADPNAKLCYNDYGTEGMWPKTNNIYNMVRDFKQRGVPIDCVGFQTHLGSVPSDFRANLQRFADLGVDVHITELDVGGSGTTQANTYAAVINACLAVTRCTGITVWGITDKYTWRPQDTPLLWDSNFVKKQAYTSVVNAFGTAQPCASNPCLNGGTCTQTSSAYTCACKSGFGGASCQTCTAGFTQYANVDAPNNDIKSVFGITSYADCQTQCTQTAGCVMFSFNAGWNGCFLKNAVGAPSSNTAFVAGVCNAIIASGGVTCASAPCANGGTCTNQLLGGYTCTCPTGFGGTNCQTCTAGFTQYASSDAPNNDIKSVFGITSYADCQTQCTQTAGCVMFSFNAGWTGCFLKNAVGTASTNAAFVAGVCSALVPAGVSPCASAPCTNGGTCGNLLAGGFTCACPAIYSGPTCNTYASVAQLKTASQSGTGNWCNGNNSPCSASYAVDNNYGQSLATGYCAHSGGCTGNQWWRVDLAAVHRLTQVLLYLRSDCCTTRNVGYSVLLSNSTTAWAANAVTVGSISAQTSNQVYTFAVPATAPAAQYVEVRAVDQCMTVCEAAVLGAPA